MSNKYNQGKIYSIRSHKTDKFYIGSTTEKYLSRRMANHRRNYKKYIDGRYNYISSFEILKYEDAYIELMCSSPCENVYQLRAIEGKFIRENENCVNKNIPGRDSKQYYQDNRDKINKYNKQYIGCTLWSAR